MKLSSVLVTFIAAVSLGACATKQAEQISFPITCKAENDKKYVQISGYIADQGVVYCSNTGGRMECSFTLTESPGSSNALRVEIAQGSGANSVEKFEGSYKPQDIKIHDNSGNLLKIGDEAKLTGTMNALPDGSLCFLTVDKIEK
jgi:hypothetical protein